MSQCPVGIGTLPSSHGRFATQGRSIRELWPVGFGHLPRTVSTRAPGVAARSQSLSALPHASNLPLTPPPRPPPPALDRTGDLPDRLLRDYLSIWTSQYTEYDYYVPPEAVYGTVPDDIRGTLFLIGPGLTEVYGTSVRHPSDADGMVCSLAFGDGGQIFFRNRYVRTRSFSMEQTLGRRVTRGLHDRGAPGVAGQPQQHAPPPAQDAKLPPMSAAAIKAAGRAAAERTEFDEEAILADLLKAQSASRAAPAAGLGMGVPKAPQLRLDPLALLGLPPLPPLSSLFNPLDTSFRAPANASVVYWGGRLLAFTEGGSLPYELNKLSLETVGQYDVGGVMADIGRLVGGYKIAQAPPQGPAGGVARPQRLVMMGTAQSALDTLLRWVELGEDGAQAGPTTTYRLPGAAAQGVLDFWVTERHYVVLQAPVDFNPQRFAARALMGTASFAECFEWDPSRPSRLHLVARPTAAAGSGAASTPPSRTRGGSSPAVVASSRTRSVSRTAPIVWPVKGPDAIIMDAPPLLATKCVGCYSLASNDRLLVFDAICQQGLSGSSGGMLDTLNAWAHRQQPKPELTRLVVDLDSSTATARVLSQRTATAATTAAAFTSGMRSASAAPALAPVGHGSSFMGGYHHLYTAASATDAAAGWAPSQVLLKLIVPPEFGVPAAAAQKATAAAAGDSANDSAEAAEAAVAGLTRRRGTGAEVWVPGDRVFIGPPTFIPRRTAANAAAVEAMVAGAGTAATAVSRASGAGGSPLPPLESEVEAASRRAAMAAAPRRREEEQDGWLLLMVHDAETMTAELCVLDAKDVTHGPVAIIPLPHHLPHLRGAHFTRAYCGPGQAAPPGWKPPAAAAGKSPASQAKKSQ